MEKTCCAVGILEVRGITASIEAADAMAKTANIEMLGTQKIGNALIYVAVCGKVTDVHTAIRAGLQTAEAVGEVYASTVLPNPSPEIFRIIRTISQ